MKSSLKVVFVIFSLTLGQSAFAGKVDDLLIFPPEGVVANLQTLKLSLFRLLGNMIDVHNGFMVKIPKEDSLWPNSFSYDLELLIHSFAGMEKLNSREQIVYQASRALDKAITIRSQLLEITELKVRRGENPEYWGGVNGLYGTVSTFIWLAVRGSSKVYLSYESRMAMMIDKGLFQMIKSSPEGVIDSRTGKKGLEFQVRPPEEDLDSFREFWKIFAPIQGQAWVRGFKTEKPKKKLFELFDRIKNDEKKLLVHLRNLDAREIGASGELPSMSASASASLPSTSASASVGGASSASESVSFSQGPASSKTGRNRRKRLAARARNTAARAAAAVVQALKSDPGGEELQNQDATGETVPVEERVADAEVLSHLTEPAESGESLRGEIFVELSEGSLSRSVAEESADLVSVGEPEQEESLSAKPRKEKRSSWGLPKKWLNRKNKKEDSVVQERALVIHRTVGSSARRTPEFSLGRQARALFRGFFFSRSKDARDRYQGFVDLMNRLAVRTGSRVFADQNGKVDFVTPDGRRITDGYHIPHGKEKAHSGMAGRMEDHFSDALAATGLGDDAAEELLEEL